MKKYRVLSIIGITLLLISILSVGVVATGLVSNLWTSPNITVTTPTPPEPVTRDLFISSDFT